MGDKLPRAGGSEGAGMLSPRTYEELRKAAERPEVVLDPVQFEFVDKAGVRHYRLRGGAGGVDGLQARGDRYIPRVGGDGGTQLFFSPGTVSYVEVGIEELDASQEIEGLQVEPVFPKLGGTRLNAAEPPSFSLAGKNSCAVWLRTLRKKCGSVVPTGAEEELLMVAKGAKPVKERGKLDRLLCELEFETGDGGGKTITTRDLRITNDVDVWYECETEDGDEGSSSEGYASSELDSSGGSDVPDSSSGSEDVCLWKMDADWSDWGSHCAPRRYREKEPTWVLWKVKVGIKSLLAKCARWEVWVEIGDGGIPKPFAGQSAVGNAVVQPLTGAAKVFGARFYFPAGVPSCADGRVTVTLVGYPAEGETDPDPCCKRQAKRVPFRWKPWCGKNCTTTVVPPP